MQTTPQTEQLIIAAQAFEELARAIDHAPYNPEVEYALFELRAELLKLGANIQR